MIAVMVIGFSFLTFNFHFHAATGQPPPPPSIPPPPLPPRHSPPPPPLPPSLLNILDRSDGEWRVMESARDFGPIQVDYDVEKPLI